MPAAVSEGLDLRAWGELPDRVRGELVDGRLVEEEQVGALHDVAVAWLIATLAGWVRARDGLIGGSDTRFAVTADRGRKPDLYAYLHGRRPPAHGLVATPPDLVVEVVSPAAQDAKRDRADKPHEYAAFGVASYWIVDPQRRTLEVFALGAAGGYERVGVFTDRVEEVRGFDDLGLDLDALWSELDRLV